MARRQTDFPESASAMPIAGTFAYATVKDRLGIGYSWPKKAAFDADSRFT
jgi:hypothetical protein